MKDFAINFTEKRLVFQKMDKAPKAPENFKSPEKQTEAAMLSEVASQTPSEIYSDTVSAGGAIAARHTKNTTILASLADSDPLGGSGGGSGGGSNSGNGSGTTTVVTSDDDSNTNAQAKTNE